MNLKQFRAPPSSDGAFGVLIFDDGYWIRTLEHAYVLPDASYSTKIPVGIWVCQRGMHQLEHGPSFETFEITGITGHSGLLFHRGNLAEDSRGCTLVGMKRGVINGQRGLLESSMAFDMMMAKLQGVNSFQLEVEEV